MILSPLQNTAVLSSKEWLQKRPVVTQGFAERPDVYKQFGMLGHNGLDLRAAIGTPVFAPFEGTIQVLDDPKGYGFYIKLRKYNAEITLGHLSKFLVLDGQKVYTGDKIALSGNSGFSTAPHLHVTLKKLDGNGNVINYDNGYFGAYNFADLVLAWKGTFTKSNL